jgi:hypothetical protein
LWRRAVIVGCWPRVLVVGCGAPGQEGPAPGVVADPDGYAAAVSCNNVDGDR